MNSSLKNIAAVLGLSTTTVSWVLSGKGPQRGISEETCERVRKCAESFNYRPNLLARSLHTGISNTIGLIVPSIGDMFYSSLARVIEFEAEKRGYALMICSSESELKRENKMVEVLRSKQVDGIMMAPTKLSDGKIVEMINDSFPFVLFDRYYPEHPTNYVIINNEVASNTLVRHLFEKGHRKVAIMTTNSHIYTMNLRYDGYLRAYTDMGMEADPNLYGMVDYNNHEQNIIAVLDNIFSKVPDVDGFFFGTHILLPPLLQYCSDRGIDYRKFGYASIHEEPIFNMITPNLNVATMPIEEMGREVVRVLMHDINQRLKLKKSVSPKQGVILSCSLNFRD